VAKGRKESGDASKLRRLLKPLGLTSSSSPHRTTDTSYYKTLLADSFSHDLARLDVPCAVTWDLLQEQQSFLHWLERDDSCLLLAGGTNWSMIDAGTLNWLSHASVMGAEYLREQSDTIACFYCQHSPIAEPRYAFHHVVASITHQITTQHAGGVSELLDDFEKAVAGVDLDDLENEEQVAKQIVDVLGVAISRLPESERVSIIIDRLDQCRWHGDARMTSGVLEAVVVALLDLVGSVRCCVKVLLVIDAASAHGLTDPDSDLVRDKRAHYLCEPNWLQAMEQDRLLKVMPRLRRASSAPTPA
ncbi:hypothetical protein LTR53_014287, partial [Teratosphaeriaceae sp. CCFEE 6253]